jgi:uncharacterized protein (DUF488 family)
MIYTIGHSTRPQRELIDILHHHAILLLVDVRTVPQSRYNPQFNRNELQTAIPNASIEYLHFPGLGGLRHATGDSLNTGWKNGGFRGFADYMLTNEFKLALELLLRTAEGKRTAVMCAEALPQQCHRLLISDALVAHGVEVTHILGTDKTEAHRMTPFAKVEGTRILYPPTQSTLDFS